MYEALGVTDTDRILKSMPDEEPLPTDPCTREHNAIGQHEVVCVSGSEPSGAYYVSFGFWR